MCGIIGCITRRPVARELFEASRDLMRARGPDDQGYFSASTVQLGARRLAIVDLSPAGHQPMVADDGRLAVVFNGEIYNYPELRRELEERFPFRSHADTEVLIHGYRAWGWTGLLARIDGMYAIGVWDEERRALLLARDRVGKKPLFYAQVGEDFYFASTLAALTALLPHRPALDPVAIDAYLVYQAVPAPLTVYRGICNLPAGHQVVVDVAGHRVTSASYWDVSYREKLAISEAEAVSEVGRLLDRAVSRRQQSDVPIGTLLSGGLDSSVVAATLARSSSRSVEAVTMGFDDPQLDDRASARLVAAQIGAHLHEEVLRASCLQALPRALAEVGQPFADPSLIPTYFLAEAAKRVMTVALNGDGGDELFGGYARPVIARVAGSYRQYVPRHVRRLLGRGGIGLPRHVAAVLRAGGAEPVDAFTYDRGLRAVRPAAYAARFWATVRTWNPDALYRAVWDAADGPDDVDHALYGDFKTYLPDQILTKMDVATMAHSLEARSPLLDTALVEFAAQLPTEIRMRGLHTKHLLRRLAAGALPAAIAARPKRGFIVPCQKWVSRSYGDHLRACLTGPRALVTEFLDAAWLRSAVEGYLQGKDPRDETVWTAWMLELWLRLQAGELRATDEIEAVREDHRAVRRGARCAPASEPVQHEARPAPHPIRTLQVGMGWFPQSPGGLNRVYYNLIRTLPAHGVEADGVVLNMQGAEQGDGWSVRALAARAGPLPLRVPSMGRDLGRLVREGHHDLVSSHFAASLWPALASLGATPLVVHFHGPWALEGAVEGWGAGKAAMAHWMERQVYRRAMRAIVLSHAFGSILADRYQVPEDRIHVIPGGVDVDRFDPRVPRGVARDLLGWPRDRPIVVAVRRLVQRMGLESLLSATAELAERIPDVWLAVVGSGRLLEALQRRAAELAITDHVSFVGRLPDDQLPLAYRAADVSVIPTQALEGFGLIAAESLAAGTPAVGTPVGGLPEVLLPLAPDLVCRSASAHDIALHLRAALMGEIRLPDSARCAEYARRHFAWTIVAERVREVYLEALGCVGASGSAGR